MRARDFTDHVHFPFLNRYFRIEWTSDSRRRFRIELRRLPGALLPFVRSVTTPCVACGAEMRPLRERARSV